MMHRAVVSVGLALALSACKADPPAPAAPPPPPAAPAPPAAPSAPAAPTTTTAAAAPAAAASPAAGAPAAADAVAEADAMYASRCVTCHGREGKADGPAAGAINPKPRSFADAAWQKSVTDEAIEKIVVVGGAAVGKSVLMPPNPDLEGKPAVVAALRAKVRKFGAGQ